MWVYSGGPTIENSMMISQNIKIEEPYDPDKKAFLGDQCKEIEENYRMGKTRDLFKKITLQTSLNLNIKVSIPHCLDHIRTSFVYCPISPMDTHHQI